MAKEADGRTMWFNRERIEDREVARLHNLAEGLLLDGNLSEAELMALVEWLDRREHLREIWPFCDLGALLRQVLADGVITVEERLQVADFLGAIASRDGQKTVNNIYDPNPVIIVPERIFLFTGKLEVCTRAVAHARVHALGGICKESVVNNLDYLVVGDLGNEQWQHSKYGRKIESVIQSKRTMGATTQIIREHDFVKAVIR